MCPQFVGLFAMGMFGAGVAYSEDPRLARLRQSVPWAISFCGLELIIFASWSRSA